VTEHGLAAEPDWTGSAVRLGLMIAEGRQAAGMTQQQLADQVGVSVGMIRDLEQGRTARPRRSTAEALSLVLGLDLDAVDSTTGWPPGNGGRPTLDQRAAPSPAGVWLGVLGPLAVWRDGVPADPGPRRQRAVLGLLAVHPGSPLHRETIVDTVWGHEPPASAVAMVQSYVSRLRRLLGETMLGSDGMNYTLVVTAAELDALEFARLADRAGAVAAAGIPAVACDWYEQALRLWRGEPLAGVSTLRGHPAVTELMQQRTVVILEYATAATAAGVPERVLPRLRALASQNPLDERVHARLMLTLAACGQQADALGTFERIRRRLSDELGVTPSAELTRAHLRILRDEAGSSPDDAVADDAQVPRSGEHNKNGSESAARERRSGVGEETARRPGAPRPRQLPLAVPQFTGRASELAELSLLAADSAGTVVISAIGGMAGIGKTALALHWAHQAAASFPDGQLYVSLRGFDLADPPVTPGEAIRGFLDALGVRSEQIPEGLDAQAALYRSVTAGRQLLIVLDNAASEEQVRPLLPGSPGCLVLITSRHQLTGLSAAEGARLITLEVLTGPDARALLTARLGATQAAADDPAAVAELARLCGCLPLALAITAARAAVRPGHSLAALADELRDTRGRLTALDTGDPAVGVRAALSWSYAQLSPAAASTFRLLGLHPGADISQPATASLTGEALSQAAQDLAELARAHLITEPSPSRYALHDLVRAYAAEQAEAMEDSEARHEAIGRVLDYYLGTACAAGALLNPTREPVSVASPRPGVTLEVLADHQQALTWFEAEYEILLTAVRLAAEAGFDVCAWQLPWTMADFVDRRGRWHDWAAIELTALEAATRTGDLTGQAVAHTGAACACQRLADYSQAHAHLGNSIALYRQLGDCIGEARTHLRFSIVCEHQGCLAESLSHDEQALRLFRAAGHRIGQAHALNSMGWSHIQLGNPRQGRSLCQQALRLHRELGDRAAEAHTWDSLGYAEHQLGRFTDASACYRRALSLLRELGDRFEEAGILTHLGDTYDAAGDPQQAREAWQQALDILDDLSHPDAEETRARLSR
jgi:DNA-binding SARP family transcriptional activator/tetratricopeptide (TPR) repeat protein/transcriptional regulator with XRE-family HTH domain